MHVMHLNCIFYKLRHEICSARSLIRVFTCLVTGKGLGHQPVQADPDAGGTHGRYICRGP